MLPLHWHIFHDVRTTFFSGTFALCMEIKLKLCFIFARHCDVYFITSQLRYLFVRCTYVFLRRQNYVILWYVRNMCRNEVTIVFQFCSLLWRIFYYVTITLFICLMQLRFFMTLAIGSILVRSNYVWK